MNISARVASALDKWAARSLGYLRSLYRLQNILIGSHKVKEFIEKLSDTIRVYFDATIGSTSVHSGENISSQVQVECGNIPPQIDMQQIEQKKQTKFVRKGSGFFKPSLGSIRITHHNHRSHQNHLYRKIDGAVLWSQNERNLDCIITFQTHSILQRFMLRFDMLQLDCNDHLYIYDGAHAATPKIVIELHDHMKKIIKKSVVVVVVV
uniref:Uncharacterized protein n=1 Tax=Glossina pallidipes TaxID=7398 RepID=A0A1B0A2I4_GLOPL